MNNHKYTKNKAPDANVHGSERSSKVARTGNDEEANNTEPTRPLGRNDETRGPTNSMHQNDEDLVDELGMKLPGASMVESETTEDPKVKGPLLHVSHPVPEDRSVMANHGDQLSVLLVPLQRMARPVAASSMDLTNTQPQVADGTSSSYKQQQQQRQ
jgi:hypothetical protein